MLISYDFQLQINFNFDFLTLLIFRSLMAMSLDVSLMVYIYLNLFALPEHLRMLLTSIIVTNFNGQTSYARQSVS